MPTQSTITKPIMFDKKYFLGLFMLMIAACNSNDNKLSEQTEKSVAKYSNIYTTATYQEELDIEGINDARVSESRFYSGKKSLHIKPETDSTSGFRIPLSNLTNYHSIDTLSIEFVYYVITAVKNIKLVWTIDDGKGNTIVWNGLPIEDNPTKTWTRYHNSFKINHEHLKAGYFVNIYFGNNEKEELWVDDFKCTFKGLKKEEPINFSSGSNYFFDLENSEQLQRADHIKTSVAHSGKTSCDLSNGQEYGFGFKKKLSDISSNVISKLSASVWIYPTQEKHDIVLTFSCVDQNSGETKFWHGKSTLNGVFPLNKWTKLNSAVNLPVDKFNLNDEIEVGIWNKGKTGAYIDDMHIVFGDQPERKSIAAINDKNKITSYQELQLYDVSQKLINDIRPGDRIVHGYYFQPQKKIESILIVGKTTAKMICYNEALKEMQLIWQTNNKNHPVLNEENICFGGDFDADQIADLLVINTQTKKWELLHYKNNDWVSFHQSSNPVPEGMINEHLSVLIDNHFERNNQTILMQSSGNKLVYYSLKNKQWQTSLYQSLHENILCNEHDYWLNWNDAKLLKFNNQWRFDLCEVAFDHNQLSGRSRLNFKGFKGNSNPKYYEHTNLVSGNFIHSNKKSLLVISYNCSRFNSDGKECSEIENNAELPNSIHFYQ